MTSTPLTSSRPKLSPKIQELSQALVAIASSLGPQAKLPTVQQLRRDFGVSIATLDSVLTHLESQNVIYRRQGSGIYVSPYLHKKTVGLVCAPEFFRAGTSPFWAEIVEDMRQRATLNGEVFRFYLGLPAGRSDVPVHEDLQDDVAARRLDGVFFIGHNPAAIEWLEAQGIAVVNFAGRATHKISIDYHNLIDQAVSALRDAGCQYLGLMTPFHYREDNPGIERSHNSYCFENCLRQRGLPFYPSLVWDARNMADTEKQSYQEQGFNAAFRLFGPQEAAQRGDMVPDGLVIVDDMMTRGTLVALPKIGVQVGRDVQIVSHTNKGAAVLQGHEHELTRIEIDPADIVQAMFEMLDQLMSGQELDRGLVEVKSRLVSESLPHS